METGEETKESGKWEGVRSRQLSVVGCVGEEDHHWCTTTKNGQVKKTHSDQYAQVPKHGGSQTKNVQVKQTHSVQYSRVAVSLSSTPF
jgi:hypothetical protein